MKKKLLIGSAVFIVVFLITFFLSFPYQNVVSKVITKTGNKTGLKITYGDIQSGPFGTTLTNLEINEIPIDSMTVSYSPFSVFTKSADLETRGLIKADATLSPSSTEYEAEISESVINKFATPHAVLSAPVTVIGTGSPNDQSADFTASVGKIELESPIGKLPFENILADISIKGNNIIVNKLTSKDDMNLNLKGSVNINPKNMARSVVNIKGTAEVFGQEKKISLTGRIGNIKPSIK